METRQIGKSGIETSALALGCWAIGGGSWWGDNDDQMSVDTIHRAFDLGIRWIDTARVYGFGHSEEVVGRALKELPRDQVIISTKCALLKMKKEGKIRAIGASNVNLQVMKDYVAAGQLDVIQEKLSILDRKPEEELLPFCEAHGISLQTYSPIEQGLLAGKAPDDYVPKPGEVREGRVWWRPENIRMANEMLAGWKDLTEKVSVYTGKSLYQVEFYVISKYQRTMRSKKNLPD